MSTADVAAAVASLTATLAEPDDDRNHNGAEPQPTSRMQPSRAAIAARKRFAEWLHCICIVTFDLELGQAMELVHPAHVRLSEAERTSICYLAFPDSNSGCMGDTQFHVRMRVQPERCADSTLSAVHRRYNGRCDARLRADAGHYWGFVYFRQIRDARRPRGYFQKSLVLLTRLPFVQLFHELCAVIAPLYFDEATADFVGDADPAVCGGLAVLEAASAQIGTWPALRVGRPLQLHLLGTVWQTEIMAGGSSSAMAKAAAIHGSNNNGLRGGISEDANGGDGFGSGRSVSGDSDAMTIIPALEDSASSSTALNVSPRVCSVQDVDIYRSLGGMLTHVHLLWELVLTGEPIVVMAGSPTDCAHMVQSLMSLIAPLCYCAESRPYFTIHDSEFREFTQRAQGPPPIILGVTNPFFAKTLQRWPHTIRLSTGGSGGFGASGEGPSHADGSASSAASAALSAVTQKLRKIKHLHQSSFDTNGLTANNMMSSSGGGNGATASSRLLDQPPGLYTAYRPFLHKDAGGEAGRALKQIQQGKRTQRPLAAQSALLRRHLVQLTQSFMIPLERYIASLMPLRRDIQPFRAAPALGCFRQDDFLATLASCGPQLTSSLRGDWPGLYKRFFRGANFKGWYDRRSAELQRALGVLQMEALAGADLGAWLIGRHEVELVDMVLKLKQKLRQCGADGFSRSARRRRCFRNRVPSPPPSTTTTAAVNVDGVASNNGTTARDHSSDSDTADEDDDDEYGNVKENCEANTSGWYDENDATDVGGDAAPNEVVGGSTRTITTAAENGQLMLGQRLRQHLRLVCAQLPEDLRRLLDADRGEGELD